MSSNEAGLAANAASGDGYSQQQRGEPSTNLTTVRPTLVPEGRGELPDHTVRLTSARMCPYCVADTVVLTRRLLVFPLLRGCECCGREWRGKRPSGPRWE
jgi:hypothetical protein